MFNISDQDNDDVVAFYINGTIYFGQGAIDKVKEVGTVDGFIRRAIFKFMAEFDLGPAWEQYAASPTLFTMAEYNTWTKK